MPEIVATQRTPEWHAAHRGRITSSIAAACLGLCPYTSRQKAFRTITGWEPAQQQNKFMRWGSRNEPKARAAYESVTGHLVNETGFWVHPELDWLGASPDGLVFGGDGLVELKCPNKLPNRVPIHHLIQIQVQLAVVGREWCDYFAWVPLENGEEVFRQRIFARGHSGLIRKLSRFRDDYVLAGIEPARKTRKNHATKTNGANQANDSGSHYGVSRPTAHLRRTS